jgi:hypothetical protein
VVCTVPVPFDRDLRTCADHRLTLGMGHPPSAPQNTRYMPVHQVIENHTPSANVVTRSSRGLTPPGKTLERVLAFKYSSSSGCEAVLGGAYYDCIELLVRRMRIHHLAHTSSPYISFQRPPELTAERLKSGFFLQIRAAQHHFVLLGELPAFRSCCRLCRYMCLPAVLLSIQRPVCVYRTRGFTNGFNPTNMFQCLIANPITQSPSPFTHHPSPITHHPSPFNTNSASAILHRYRIRHPARHLLNPPLLCCFRKRIRRIARFSNFWQNT